MKVLVLGGYGNFGARICRALAHDTDIALYVGGRRAQQAQSLASSLGADAQGVAVDWSQPDFVEQLKSLQVELLIHTAGPFQGQDYRVAHAAAQAGAHYIDLADGRRFVCDFPAALQAAFHQAGRVAVCGASTVPALSSAVVKALCADWQQIDTVDICIAPAQTAPRGVATLAAVLGYCGAPIAVWEQGQWQTHYGWADPVPVQFHRLRTRKGALCDIPDLEIFPSHFAVRERVMFRAALEVGFTQWVFARLAAASKAGWLRRPERFAALFQAVAPWLDGLGSALGGMVVQVRGRDAHGQVAHAAWHISADHDHGPEIPCMAAILMARQLARGQGPRSGAYTSTGLLPLDAFAPEFARWGMVTDVVRG